jgi:hypothetical protein
VLQYLLFGTSSAAALNNADLSNPVSPISKALILSRLEMKSLPLLAAQNNRPFLTWTKQ